MLSTSLLYPKSALLPLLEVFLNLPDSLRPTHVSTGEDGPFEPIESTRELQIYAKKRDIGFYLKGQKVLYDLMHANKETIKVNCFFSASIQIYKNFLPHMAQADPIFAFCCTEEERERKNRLIMQLGTNKIESWVGRSCVKYVPGLYWLTLFSNELLSKHNIEIFALKAIAKDHLDINSTHYLFRFYNTPEEWVSHDGEIMLRAPFPGVFDIEKVRAQVIGVESFLELTKILHAWT